jgi:hypothetical protein
MGVDAGGDSKPRKNQGIQVRTKKCASNSQANQAL